MIQSYLDLNLSVEDYNKKSFDGQEREYGKIQKAYSSPHFIVLSVRFKGKTRFLYLGRGNNYEGLWESDKNIPSQLRIKDRYLDYIRKYLVGSRLGDIECDHQDRIIHIHYYKKSKLNIFSIFWRGRQLYFANSYQDEKGKRRLYLCWENLKDNIQHLENEKSETLINSIDERFQIIGKSDLKSKGEKRNQSIDIEAYVKKHVENSGQKVFPKRKKKFFQRKQARISADLKKIMVWRDLKTIADDQSYVFPDEKKFKILGIKFERELTWNQFKVRDLVYKKVKAYRKAEEILRERLENTKEEVKAWNTGEIFTNQIGEKIISPEWFQGKKQKGKLNISENNVQVIEYNLNEKRLAVGKTSLSNDYLRTQWAKKDDMWFHIDSMKSSHLIIKCKNASDLTSEEMAIIGSIIRDMSTMDILDIPLVFTQVKNLKGIKGKPGAVTMKKQRYLVVSYIENWKEIIAND